MKDKLKAFLANPQSRLIIVFGGIAGSILMFFLLSYLFSALNLFGSEGTSVAKVAGTPSIESIPGVGDPSVEYSRLIADQNEASVEKAEQEGGSALPTIIRPQYSLNTHEFNEGYNKSKNRDADRCSRDNLIKARKAGVAASELRCYGCSAEDLKAAGYGAGELRAAGFSAEALKSAGFSAEALKAAGFTGAELREAGFGASELLQAGYSTQELLDSGFTPKQLMSAGVSVASLRAAGVDVEALLADGVSTNDMIRSGYCTNGVMQSIANPKQLRLDGVSALDLYVGGATIEQLRSYGYPLKEIMDTGVTLSQLLAAGVSASELRDVGIAKKDVAFAEKNLSQIKGDGCSVEYAKAQYNAGVQARVLWPLGCSAEVLREASYSALDLIKEGVTPGQLRIGGYTASQLVGAGVELQALVEACYSIDNLLEAGFNAGQLASAGVPVSDLLAYGFTANDLAASGVDCGEMYKGGVPVAKLYEMGCDASELKRSGASAAELLNAGFSAGDLRSAGFGTEELLAAGLTAEELLRLGISPDELLAAGYTEGQLLRAGARPDQIYDLQKDQGIGCSVERIDAAFAQGSTVRELLEKGCSVESLVSAGVSVSELLTAGASAADLLKAGVSVEDLLDAGMSVEQLIAAGVKARDLYTAGISIDQLKGYTIDQLREAGYDVSEYGEQNDFLDLDSEKETDLERIQRLQNDALDKQDRERRVLQLASAMQAQASALFSNWDVYPRQSINTSTVKPEDYGSSVSGGSGFSPYGVADLGPVVKAGTMMYATMDNSVSSDDPTPIRATIVSGPLKGARVLGEFEQDGKKLVLKFDRVDIPGQRNTKDITLFAVDVNTARNVSVDNHYLLKYGSLFAASFLEGLNDVSANLGKSVTTKGDTVTVKEGTLDKTKVLSSGLGKVGKNLVEETTKFQSIPPTIHMQVGATFGILVMEDFTVGVS